MTQVPWLMLVSLAITAVVTRGSLWMRNIRPAKRVGLWEHMTWQVAPKDEQTKEYLKQGLLTAIVVLPVTLLVLHAVTELYGR